MYVLSELLLLLLLLLLLWLLLQQHRSSQIIFKQPNCFRHLLFSFFSKTRQTDTDNVAAAAQNGMTNIISLEEEDRKW